MIHEICLSFKEGKSSTPALVSRSKGSPDLIAYLPSPTASVAASSPSRSYSPSQYPGRGRLPSRRLEKPAVKRRLATMSDQEGSPRKRQRHNRADISQDAPRLITPQSQSRSRKSPERYLPNSLHWNVPLRLPKPYHQVTAHVTQVIGSLREGWEKGYIPCNLRVISSFPCHLTIY